MTVKMVEGARYRTRGGGIVNDLSFDPYGLGPYLWYGRVNGCPAAWTEQGRCSLHSRKDFDLMERVNEDGSPWVEPTPAPDDRDARIAALEEENARLRAEVERVQSDRQYIIGFNAGWDEALTVTLVFPTMLRKMWSGTEVQLWIDETLEHLRAARAALEAKP